ncbi:BatD family protein [Flavobacterium crassostreae]|uniref:BatD protein n=1 Tax=Flavobacterium crassostreae TaxID=1763534 RepID=A0A1B9E5P4_9FLAO|nr:BatD family protein [Flavobacterium crassostreae]OCB77280.1 BatD protein [Flavobacterium crassostreae]
MKKFLFIVLWSFQGLLAQVQFEAKVSKTTLGLNERLRIDFAMNIDGDNFNEPSFDGFQVIAGPSQQVSQSWINGRSSFEKIYSYYLLPNRKGILTIKPATIEYNGQIYKTTPIKVTVTAAVEQPKDPNDTSISADNNLYLIATISKTNPYVNEPITVVYKLYFANIGISNFRELNKPKYNDFWSQNIEIKQLEAEEGIFKGENYRYVVLKKVVLYPQKSGKLIIEPLTLDVDVQLPTNRRDIFGRMLLSETSKKVSAGAKTIQVRPLPESGKPDDFTGAVGTFDFKVTPSKTSLKNGESLDLLVHVTGKGNLKLFSLPKPVVPNALEMYDAVHQESVTTSLAGMSGKITDKYAIVPQYKGNYPIKPLRFSYFDLNSGSYKTLSSPEILIQVLNGPTDTRATDSLSIASGTNTIHTPQFANIKTNTELKPTNPKDFFGSTTYFWLLLLPFLGIPLLILFKNKKEAFDRDIVGSKIRNNNRLAKKYLSQAKKQTHHKELFYIALEKAMHNFLKAKLHMETSEMSKDNIKTILLDKNANPATVDQFIALTENCEIARYAPASSAAIQNDYDKAVSIIASLEKEI